MYRIINIFILLWGCSLNVLSYDCLIDGIAYNRISNTEFEVTRISDSYYNNYNGDIIIPESVSYKGRTFSITRIGKKAFSHDKIKSISFPNTLKSIGEDAFESCEILSKKLAIPASLRSVEFCGLHLRNIDELYIDDIASWCTIEYSNPMNSPLFQNCPKIYLSGKLLENVVIPNGVTFIAHCSFKSESIKNVTIPNSVKTIGCEAFSFTSIKSIVIPNSVNKIYDRAFSNCTQLVEVNIPDGVNELEMDLFSHCHSLKSIRLHPHIKSIGEYCFSFCSSLESINIPTDTELIERYAFCNCTKLSKIVLSSNLKEIESGVFGGCDNLNTICSLAASPPRIDEYTFTSEQLSFSSLYVPATSIDLYRNAPIWRNFFDIFDITLKVPSLNREKNLRDGYNIQGLKINNRKGLRIIISEDKRKVLTN